MTRTTMLVCLWCKSRPRRPGGATSKQDDAAGVLRHLEDVLSAVPGVHTTAGSASEHALGVQEHHHSSHTVHSRT